MKRIDFTEKVILTLSFFVEAMVILLFISMLSSCKTKKQAESKQSEKTEILMNVKTTETATDSAVNVVRDLVIENIMRDFYATMEFLKLSEPDSAGRQHITAAATINLSDKSKINKQTEKVDSANHKATAVKTTEDNSKIKDEVKTESKTKSEVDSKGWTVFFWIIGIGLIIGLAIFIFKKLK